MTFKMSKIKTVLFCAAVLMLAGIVIASADEGSVLGDANTDGAVTVSDVTVIQRVLADIPVEDGFSESAADVDRNGIVEISDAMVIQRWVAELETPYPIGEQIEEPTQATTAAPTEMPTDEDGWGQTVFRP